MLLDTQSKSLVKSLVKSLGRSVLRDGDSVSIFTAKKHVEKQYEKFKAGQKQLRHEQTAHQVPVNV